MSFDEYKHRVSKEDTKKQELLIDQQKEIEDRADQIRAIIIQEIINHPVYQQSIRFLQEPALQNYLQQIWDSWDVTEVVTQKPENNIISRVLGIRHNQQAYTRHVAYQPCISFPLNPADYARSITTARLQRDLGVTLIKYDPNKLKFFVDTYFNRETDFDQISQNRRVTKNEKFGNLVIEVIDKDLESHINMAKEGIEHYGRPDKIGIYLTTRALAQNESHWNELMIKVSISTDGMRVFILGSRREFNKPEEWLYAENFEQILTLLARIANNNGFKRVDKE